MKDLACPLCVNAIPPLPATTTQVLFHYQNHDPDPGDFLSDYDPDNDRCASSGEE